MAWIVTSILFLAVGGASVGVNVPPPPNPVPTHAPPPVAEFLKQQHPPQLEEGDAPLPPQQNVPGPQPEVPAAPPPVAQYRRQHPSPDVPPQVRRVQHRVPNARPTPPMVLANQPRWALPVGYNAHHLGNLEDPSLLHNIVYDLDVGSGGLTALKDDAIQACFIDHYKVPFVVPRDQRRFYTHTLPGVLVDTPKDRAVFKDMVGRTIYDMCHHVRTYWLDNQLYYLYMKLLAEASPPSAQGVAANHPGAQGRDGGGNIPAVLDDDVMRQPPPVSLYHVLQQQQQGHVRNGRPGPQSGPAHNRAPPPVALYRLQHPH